VARTRARAVGQEAPDHPGGRREAHPRPGGERDFHSEITRRLALLRREIEFLRSRAATVPGEAREEYLELAEGLDLNAERLEQRVRDYFDRPDESWESFRAGAQEARRDLERTLLRVATSLRQRHPQSVAGKGGKRPGR